MSDTYKVTMKKVEIYQVIVRASSQLNAVAIGEEMIDDDPGRLLVNTDIETTAVKPA
jgi:hypothetical protein